MFAGLEDGKWRGGGLGYEYLIWTESEHLWLQEVKRENCASN